MTEIDTLAEPEAAVTENVKCLEELTFKRILLLESDPATADRIKAALETSSFDVNAVTTGPEGLRTIMKQRSFDIILCDMADQYPPGLGFYKAVRQLRPDLKGRFIFTTGHTRNPEVDSFIRRLNGVVLSKPFEPSAWIETIHLVLQKEASDSSGQL